MKKLLIGLLALGSFYSYTSSGSDDYFTSCGKVTSLKTYETGETIFKIDEDPDYVSHEVSGASITTLISLAKIHNKTVCVTHDDIRPAHRNYAVPEKVATVTLKN